ncbi:hypothetical protein FIBSPDRAFT_872354 [Athelia psychrophila]|uniref:Uncharacterized protein n=1 Tax=Athelia psychrophila TaxID=1759441 RepID=A0A165ZJP2_9AGAM|nr:hypothetical protein FIBSPDRAFT_872354 [Fibularhizoctonia sp. CBS 109695]
MAFRPHYQAVLTIPALALESVMTCRVHRAVIMGLINNGERNTAPVLLTTFIDDRAPRDPEGLYTKYGSRDQSGEMKSTLSNRM